jgi:hypothetical protein
MKVYIGPYKDWIGPYQIADMVFFWLDSWPNEEQEKRWDYRLYDKFGDWLASTWVNKFCEWVHKKRPQVIKIHIDKYDTWGMDHTLAPIILPMLKQLHKTKYGAPWVDDEDVPEELRSTNAPPLTEDEKNIGEVDDNFAKRWDWVLEEMIWAFEQKVDESSDDRFYLDGFDKVGYEVWQKRKTNGFKLFGKYYENLWD